MSEVTVDKQAEREQALANLRARANSTVKATEKKNVSESKVKKSEASEEDKKVLAKASMTCLVCDSGSKPKKQCWLGEHLVNTHAMTLSDYIEAFYTPKNVTEDKNQAISAEKRAELAEELDDSEEIVKVVEKKNNKKDK